MLGVVNARGWLLAGALITSGIGRADAASCPASASLVVFAENQNLAGSTSVHVEGQLLDSGATCDGEGATTYSATLACAGSGTGRCGQIDGLRPGSWVHRIQVQADGSDEQLQSQRSVLLAAAPGVRNAVSWTVYPRTFVVRQASGDALRAALDAAAGFTAATPGARALV